MMRDLVDTAMDDIYSTFSAEEIEVLSESEEPRTIRGIFEESSMDVNHGDLVLTSTSPRLTVWEEDLLGNLSSSQRFRINGEVFEVKDIDRDGYGNITLELYRV